MKVLLLDNWSEKAREIISDNFIGSDDILPTKDVDGVIIGLNQSFNMSVLTGLKFIASCTTGLDHIDTEYCKAKGIKIISLQGETEFLQDVWATAEHTWGLIMSLVRKIPFAYNDVCAGNWEREAWQGTELRGKTLGIVGYGRVGRQVKYLTERSFKEVIWYDKKNWEGNAQCKCCKGHSLDYVLQNSDIITVHVPLNDETRGMFGAKEFAMMKPGAYFINTSRGAVVDEEALINALFNSQIAGAALDVVCNEPNIYEPLREYAAHQKNLIITSHIAGNTAESREKTQLFIANKIKDFIQGGG